MGKSEWAAYLQLLAKASKRSSSGSKRSTPTRSSSGVHIIRIKVLSVFQFFPPGVRCCASHVKDVSDFAYQLSGREEPSTELYHVLIFKLALILRCHRTSSCGHVTMRCHAQVPRGSRPATTVEQRGRRVSRSWGTPTSAPMALAMPSGGGTWRRWTKRRSTHACARRSKYVSQHTSLYISLGHLPCTPPFTTPT